MSFFVYCNPSNPNDRYFKKIFFGPKSVEYEADINGRFALCKLKQIYQIFTEQPISEAKYEFPVDYNSAFCNLVILTPREEIQGVVQEKKEAQRTYEKGKEEENKFF